MKPHLAMEQFTACDGTIIICGCIHILQTKSCGVLWTIAKLSFLVSLRNSSFGVSLANQHGKK